MIKHGTKPCASLGAQSAISGRSSSICQPRRDYPIWERLRHIRATRDRPISTHVADSGTPSADALATTMTMNDTLQNRGRRGITPTYVVAQLQEPSLCVCVCVCLEPVHHRHANRRRREASEYDHWRYDHRVSRQREVMIQDGLAPIPLGRRVPIVWPFRCFTSWTLPRPWRSTRIGPWR